MSIKCYDTSGKYWGEFNETRGLFIPSEEVLADRKNEPQMETQISNLTFEKADEGCKGCKHYKLTCDLFSEICKYESQTERR